MKIGIHWSFHRVLRVSSSTFLTGVLVWFAFFTLWKCTCLYASSWVRVVIPIKNFTLDTVSIGVTDLTFDDSAHIFSAYICRDILFPLRKGEQVMLLHLTQWVTLYICLSIVDVKSLRRPQQMNESDQQFMLFHYLSDRIHYETSQFFQAKPPSKANLHS